MPRRPTLLVILAALATGAAGTRQAPTAPHNLDQPWPISARVTSTLVTYHVGGDAPVDARARLNLPKTASPAARVPAVVFVHGTSGVDGRGAFNNFPLNEAGIATFEIDMWEARGLAPSPTNRARLQPTLPFIFAAYRYLAAQPGIDPARIGIEGESMGGGIALRAVSAPTLQSRNITGIRFAASVALYPNCTQFVTAEHLPPMTGAPILIMLGSNDEDTNAEDCQALARQTSAAITVYPGATHQWDEQQGRAISFYDPLANRGQGGTVNIVPAPAIAEQSRAAGAAFFRRAFGMP